MTLIPNVADKPECQKLKAAGLNIGFGSDCVMDPWYSLGKADMLDVAHMGLHVGQLSSLADMQWCFDAVTQNSANILKLEGYGIEIGNQANMVLLQATDKIEAIRLRATRLAVIRDGKIISTTLPAISELNLPDRSKSLNPAVLDATLILVSVSIYLMGISVKFLVV